MVSLETGLGRQKPAQLRSCGYDGIPVAPPPDVPLHTSPGNERRASSMPAASRMHLPPGSAGLSNSLPMPLPRAMPPPPKELPMSRALPPLNLSQTSLACPQAASGGTSIKAASGSMLKADCSAPPTRAMIDILSEMSSFGAAQKHLQADVSTLVKSVGSVRELLAYLIEDLQTELDNPNFRGSESPTNGSARRSGARKSLSKKSQRARSQRRVRRGNSHYKDDSTGQMLESDPKQSLKQEGLAPSDIALIPNGFQSEEDVKLVCYEEFLARASQVTPGDRLSFASRTSAEADGDESFWQGLGHTSTIPNSLSSRWPTDIESHEPLRQHMNVIGDCRELLSQIQMQTDSVLHSPATMSRMSLKVRESLLKSDEESRSCMRRWILNPNHNFRMTLDIMSLLVLFHDLTIIPFVLAWDIELVGPLGATAMLTLIFWTFDIPISFITGYYDDQGELRMEPAKIAMKYLRTWFTIDAFVVIVDWFSTILSRAVGADNDGNGSYAESLSIIKMSKLGRLLRLFSVLRLIRGNKIFERLMEHSLSDYLHIGIQVIKIFFAILAIAHWMCCAWYAVGRLGSSPTWLDHETITEDLVTTASHESRPILWQYFSSFHWSVSQMASGSMDIPPQNALERSFNILCLLFGLLFGSSLVSLLSAFLVQLQDLRSEETKVMAQLRKYLRQNAFSHSTAVEVQKQCKERIGRQKRMNDHEIKVLDLIANSLRQRLKFESFSPFIHRHPLIRVWTEVEIAATEYLCSNAVTYLFLEVSDDFLEPGVEATHAYLHHSGRLHYLDYGHPDSMSRHSVKTVQIEEGSWMCEVALWAEWKHVGVLEAMSPCQLMSLEVKSFWEAACKFPSIALITKEYGSIFHQRLISSYPPTATYPNDVYVPFTDFAEITNAMQEDMRRIVGQISLQKLHVSYGKKAYLSKHRKEMHNLEREVASGKCTLIVNRDGVVQRVVAVVAINLTQVNGLLLVQIGSINDDGSCTANLNLPGTKMDRGETPKRAVQRLLYTELLPFMGASDLKYTEQSLLEKESEHYGVLSKYHRIVFHAKLAEWFDDHQKMCQITAGLETGRISSSGSNGETHSFKLASRTQSFKQTQEYFNEHTFFSRSVYVITSAKGKVQAFTWLTDEELGHLKSPEGNNDLEYWCQHLRIEPHLIPEPCQKFPI